MTYEEQEWNPATDVYYRIYMTDDGPVVVTMQWFDEYDYNQKRFLNDRRYEYKEQAEQALYIFKIIWSLRCTL